MNEFNNKFLENTTLPVLKNLNWTVHLFGRSKRSNIQTEQPANSSTTVNAKGIVWLVGWLGCGTYNSTLVYYNARVNNSNLLIDFTPKKKEKKDHRKPILCVEHVQFKGKYKIQ
ncbi:hypothetical protein BLOT_010219 [Blomia tropicalis]|nr:hypothetical protein BLOT_010219 [Blomia tropicalis]